MYFDFAKSYVSYRSHNTHGRFNRLRLLKTALSFAFAVVSPQEEELKDAFERLDVDSTGFISRDNLKAVLGETYDNSLIDKMFKVRFCLTRSGERRDKTHRQPSLRRVVQGSKCDRRRMFYGT